jgi:hypothetical protein
MANLTEKEKDALQAITYTEEPTDTPKALLFMAFIYMPILYLLIK